MHFKLINLKGTKYKLKKKHEAKKFKKQNDVCELGWPSG
jgi:hypothetical protein